MSIKLDFTEEYEDLKLVPHCCLITKRQKASLEELRYKHGLNFSAIIREGIELVAKKYEQTQSTRKS